MNRKQGSNASDVGTLLRQWRSARGKSQFDLSIDTGVSQRHISFIETGRSVPGRDTLMELATVLDVPFRDRNSLLLAAGYAPMYEHAAWDADEMKSVKRALDRILQHHNPYPAVVMDRYWNVQMANHASQQFFASFVDLAARPSPRNLLHLMFDPLGMRPFVVGWEQVARSLLQRVLREAVGGIPDDTTNALVAALRAYPAVEPAWQSPPPSRDPHATSPVIPISFIKDGTVLNYFSMVSTVGTPQTIAAQELRVECMYPADDATEHAHARLMQQLRN